MAELKNRILFLDIARGFAVLFMFTQHCMLVHEIEAGESEHFLSLVFTLLGTAPAAPVFMVLMGAFQMKSRSSMKKQILRGVKLFALGLLLNLLRLPMMIVEGEGGRIILSQTIRSILVFNDILQLAGLSYIMGALIRPLMALRFFPPVLIIAILLLSPFFWGLYPENPFLMMFWGTGEIINFPFFPWVVYPLLGMYLSPFLVKSGRGAEDRVPAEIGGGLAEIGGGPAESGGGLDRRLSRLALTGGALLIAGELFVHFRLLPVGDYSRSGLGIHLLIMGFIFIWLKLCRMAELSLRAKGPILRLLCFLSVNTTTVYFVQWILFAWSIPLLGGNRQNPYVASLIGMAVFLLTFFLVRVVRARLVFSFTKAEGQAGKNKNI